MSISVKNITLNKELIQSRITEARMKRDFSYGDLSEKTGMSKSSLYSLEHNFSDTTSLLAVMSVAKALGVELSWLIGAEKK